MGANEFMQRGRGTSPAKAFATAREEAAYENGHDGYTGTLAEKNEYVIIIKPDTFAGSAVDYANHLMSAEDARINDKWGPAGCIKIGPDPENKNQNIYLFFGWASS